MLRQRGRYGPLVTRHLDSALSNIKSVIFTAQNTRDPVIAGETALIDFDEFLYLLVREHSQLLCAVRGFKERALCSDPVWGVRGTGAGTVTGTGTEKLQNINNNANDQNKSRERHADMNKEMNRSHGDRDHDDDREFVKLNLQLLRFSGYHNDSISVNYLSYFPLQVTICEMNELFHELVNNDDERKGHVDITTFESAVLFLHRLSRRCSPTHRILPSDDISVFLKECRKRFRCGPNYDQISYLAVWGTVLSCVVQNMDIIGYSVVSKRGVRNSGRDGDTCDYNNRDDSPSNNCNCCYDCEHNYDTTNDNDSNNNDNCNNYDNNNNNNNNNHSNNNDNNNNNNGSNDTFKKRTPSLPLTLPQLLLTAVTESQRGLAEERASALLGYLGSMQCVVNTTSIPTGSTSYSNCSTFDLGSTTSLKGYTISSNVASIATTRPSSPSTYTPNSPVPPPSTSTSPLPPDCIPASEYIYPPGLDPITAKHGTGTWNGKLVVENADLSHLPLSGFWRPHTGETTEFKFEVYLYRTTMLFRFYSNISDDFLNHYFRIENSILSDIDRSTTSLQSIFKTTLSYCLVNAAAADVRH
jgi:hypothetical protein